MARADPYPTYPGDSFDWKFVSLPAGVSYSQPPGGMLPETMEADHPLYGSEAALLGEVLGRARRLEELRDGDPPAPAAVPVRGLADLSGDGSSRRRLDRGALLARFADARACGAVPAPELVASPGFGYLDAPFRALPWTPDVEASGAPRGGAAVLRQWGSGLADLATARAFAAAYPIEMACDFRVVVRGADGESVRTPRAYYVTPWGADPERCLSVRTSADGPSAAMDGAESALRSWWAGVRLAIESAASAALPAVGPYPVLPGETLVSQEPAGAPYWYSTVAEQVVASGLAWVHLPDALCWGGWPAPDSADGDYPSGSAGARSWEW